MKKYSKKTLLANTFGSLGYIFCLMLWAWVGILYIPILLENENVERLLLPQPREEIIAPITTSGTSPVLAVAAVTATIVVLIITIIVLLRAPIAIARTGKTVTSKAASSALPLITRGKPLTPAKKRLLTTELIKLAKLLLVILPVAICSLGFFVETPLPFDMSIFVSSILALIAVAWFSAQYVAARFLAIDTEALV